MNVTIHIGHIPVRHWHLALLQRLAGRPGTALHVARTPGPAVDAMRVAAALFRCDAILHGLKRPGLSSPANAGALVSFETSSYGHADLILDLAGDLAPSEQVWRLTFDGIGGEDGLVAAAIAGRAPIATLSNSLGTVATGRLGTEHQGLSLAAIDDALARVVTLIVAALDGAASRDLPVRPLDIDLAPIAVPSDVKVQKRIAKNIGRFAAWKAYQRAYRAPHWRIGWRRIDGPDLVDLRQHPTSGWTDLPDDGRRFYADPFPFEHKGAVTLFVEEFNHATQKGIISAVAFDAKGPVGTPQCVLEFPYHTSYPFVFEQDGEIWMIPETCAAASINLYRATAYPGGWVHEARLVENVAASDATLFEQDGRWWMFASVQDRGGSYSDTLHLWSAPSYRGPWTPHKRNPVLIDIASARPAGRIVARDGALFRPVQDCTQGYGHALSLARITRLDDDGFEQVVETTLTAGVSWPGRRIHTLNSAGGLEFIDGSAFARRSIGEMIGLRRPAG